MNGDAQSLKELINFEINLKQFWNKFEAILTLELPIDWSIKFPSETLKNEKNIEKI